MRIKLYDLMFSLSGAMDLVAPELFNHHQQVAYLSYQLGREMGFCSEDTLNLLMAGIVHDIGSLSMKERLVMIRDELEEINTHAFRGASLLEKYPPFTPLAAIIRYHHLPWNHGEGASFDGKAVPILSHILHLADRVCVLFTGSKHVLLQLTEVLAKIREGEGSRYLPSCVDAMMKLAEREHVWLELNDRDPLRFLHKDAALFSMELDLDEVLQISEIFSHVIDFRSRFTATHSAGVAHTARMLGEMSGMSSSECDMLLIAGYLHDLGKITIDNEILEKPGQLDAREYKIIRSHTFYTYWLLSQVPGLETVAEWAAFHHEKLNGNGYPFHLTEKALPYGARIMAVADIFTAITEKRPYREGMIKEQAIRTMRTMVDNGTISREIVELLADHYDLFQNIREESEKRAHNAYEEFFRLSEEVCPA